ncbi:MAG: hypothetical protein JOY67_05080 [Hyphomicrobiales bacterium]|nr:hypothetical protein [Hyphomicrobiales bacterium]
MAEARSREGAAELVTLGPYDHNDTVFHAAPQIRTWFDQVSGASRPQRRIGCPSAGL